MKSIRLLAVVILLFSIPVAAQQKIKGSGALNKLVNEAVNNIQVPKNFCHVDIKKGIVMNDLNAFCADNDFILAQYDLRQENRFGEYVDILYGFDFIPENMYPLYLFNNMGTNKYLKIGDPKPATAIIFMNLNGKLSHKESVQWTGPVIDGFANGEGIAYYYVPSKNQYLFMVGAFSKGLPVGHMDYYFYQNNNSYYSERNRENNDIEVSAIGGEGMRSFKQPSTKDVSIGGFINFIGEHNDWGFIDDSGNVVIEPQFTYVSAEFENGRATVYLKNREFYIDKNCKDLGNSKHQKEYDYKIALMHVTTIGEWDAQPRCWDYIITRNDLLKAIEDDRKALKYIEKYHDDNFIKYKPAIVLHHAQLEDLLPSANEEFRRAKEKSERRMQEYMAKMELKEAKDNNDVQITKFPDTKISATIFDGYDYKMTGGILTTNLGRSYSYTIYYEDDGDIYGYSWDIDEYATSRIYTKWENMKTALINHDNEL